MERRFFLLHKMTFPDYKCVITYIDDKKWGRTESEREKIRGNKTYSYSPVMLNVTTFYRELIGL